MTAHDDYQAYVLGLGPIAYWTFQGLAPGALHDISGNGHDLTGFGAFTLANAMGSLDGFQAASLDGVSAFFTPAGGNLRPALFTYLAVHFPTGGDSSVFSTESVAALTGNGSALIVGDAGHNFSLGVRMETGATNVGAQDTKPFGTYGTGPLLHAGSYDGINLSCSINGAVIIATLGLTYAPGATQAQIGRAAYGGKFYKGLISDLAIFSRAVVLSDIAQAAALGGMQGPLSSPQVLADLALILKSVRKTF